MKKSLNVRAVMSDFSFDVREFMVKLFRSQTDNLPVLYKKKLTCSKFYVLEYVDL